MILTVEDLCAGYGESMILNGVSLSVDRSETVAVLGPNGSGKTTLLKSIMGLLKPRKGRVLLLGQEVTGLEPKVLLKSGVGYANVGKGVVPSMSVIENLKMGAYVLNDRNKIAENLEKVYALFPDLKKIGEQKAGLLSGGQQQMLALGSSLMLDPSILLLDEPSVGLAPKFQDMIFERIRELKSTGVSILLVEQNVHRAMEVTDRGYVLEMGKVSLQGTSKELLSGTKLEDLYFGGHSRDYEENNPGDSL